MTEWAAVNFGQFELSNHIVKSLKFHSYIQYPKNTTPAVGLCYKQPLPGAILEQSSGGSSSRIVRRGTTPLLYRARADHASYVTHAQCAMNSLLEFQSITHSSGVYPSKHTAVKSPFALVDRNLNTQARSYKARWSLLSLLVLFIER